MTRLVLALLASLFLTACGEAARLDALASQGRAKVVEAPTGDTLRLEDGRMVKLAGLWAPKLTEPYGESARQQLAEMVLGQEIELLAAGAKTDPFGRTLAQVRMVRGRRWVQGQLLENGAARVRTFSDSRALAALMLRREAEARNESRGLWRLPDYRVQLPVEAAQADPGFRLVEGQVRQVRTGVDSRTLDLGGLRLIVPARAIADFDRAGRSPADLEGRLIRVRGYVGRDGDMRLDHPEAIEILKR